MKPGAGLILLASIVSLGAVAAGIETWKEDTAAAFRKGRRDGVTVSDAGRIRLARKLVAAPKLDALRVWDLARSSDGALYAATGDEGKVFRRRGAGDWEVAHDSGDTQVLSLVALRDGKVLAGTGPSGLVIDVTDPSAKGRPIGPGVLYVWDLAADPDGNVFAATGPQGQLWKRSATGAWTLVFDSPQAHLLCLALAADGSVYAGSDGEGIVYRLGADGKVTALFDAPQNEVKALAVAPDGTVYAGTGAESPASPPNGQPVPADNSVYRIGPEGSARELLKLPKTMVLALAWDRGNLLVGTGPEGLLHEVDVEDREATPLARVDQGHLTAVVADVGGVWLGSGDPAAVYRLETTYIASGTLTSAVHDAKLVSRFGAATWKADEPAGTKVEFQVRTGNTGEPDATWSAWSPPLIDSTPGAIPGGRFAQYRATLHSTNPRSTPLLRSFSIRYRSANAAPELAKLEVPDLSQGDGTPRKGKLAIQWEASDPNGDSLAFTLEIRKEGWPAWVALNEKPTAEKKHELDLAAIPDGTYRLKVRASDRPSNDPREALTRELISDPFVVDHRPPSVALARDGDRFTAKLRDDSTRIASAEFSIDGGEWTPAFPVDGLFDTGDEAVSIPIPALKPGAHLLVVRALDGAGNVGSADLVFPAP
ncbi:MAG: hypothetical protein U0800_23020 [Isosphaeraceae bacterium]